MVCKGYGLQVHDDTTQVQVVRNLIGLNASDTMRRNFESVLHSARDKGEDNSSGHQSSIVTSFIDS